MSPKKIIIIAGVFFGVLAIGLGIYFAWQKSRELIAPPSFPIAPTSSGSFPTISPNFQETQEQSTQAGIVSLKLRAISDQSIFDYWIKSRPFSTSTPSANSEQTEIFYLTDNGQIFKVVESGDDTMISSQTIQNIQSMQSSRDGRWIAVKVGDLTSSRIHLFDTEKGIWQLMPNNVMALSFSPDSKKMIYLEKNAANSNIGNLVIKDLTGANPKTTKIISLNQKDFNLKWLTAEQVLLISKPSSQYESDVWSVNIKRKTINLLTTGKGLMINFADDASWGLKFSVDQNRAPHLQLIDKEGELKANVDFFTLPNKCLPTLSAIYCAVPRNDLSTKKIKLPDDYLKKGIYFNDSIYRIDLNQNNIDGIYLPGDVVIDAFRLSTLNSDRILFINRYDKKLYSLEL